MSESIVSLGLEPSPPISSQPGDSYVVHAWVEEVLNADKQLTKAVERFKRVLRQAVQHRDVRSVLSNVLKRNPFMMNSDECVATTDI